MIEIDDKIISLELFTARFCCDLSSCRGICCVEGNSGAPLDLEEADILNLEWVNYESFMTKQGIRAINEQGHSVLDVDGDLTTPLVNNMECAYSIEHNGSTWCAIERAWTEGKTTFRKPISCHLYPIRERVFSNNTIGLQYHVWDICKAAEVLGQIKGEPLFVTLKEPIVRRYGIDFFNKMQEAYTLLSAQTKSSDTNL